MKTLYTILCILAAFLLLADLAGIYRAILITFLLANVFVWLGGTKPTPIK